MNIFQKKLLTVAVLSTFGGLPSVGSAASAEAGADNRLRIEDDQYGTTASGVQADLADTTIATTGNGAYGIYESGGATVNATRVAISTSGISATGVYTQNTGSNVNLIDSHVSTSGTYAVGVQADTYAGMSIQNSLIETSGNFSSGAVVTTNHANITVNQSDIRSSGNRSYGLAALYDSVISASNSTVLTTGANSNGLYLFNGKINLQNTQVRTEGANAIGAGLTGASTLNIDGGSLVSAQGNAIEVYGLTGAGGAAGAAIALKNGAQVIGGSGTLLLVGNDVAPINLSMDGGVYAEGDIVSKADTFSAVTNVSLSNASHWQGATDGAVKQLSMSGGSRWTMTKDSTVGALDINDSVVGFKSDGGFKTLTVSGDLSGNGTFEMNSDVAALQGDLLKVEGTASGSHQILMHNSGAEPSAAGQHLMVVQTEGGDARFNLSNTGGVVDVGTYQYSLESGDQVGGRGTDQYLVNTGRISTAADAGINTAPTSQLTWFTEMNSLVKRLGELRLGKDEGGVWARTFAKQQNVDNKVGSAFDQRLYGTQFGADTSFRQDNGRWYVGGMAGLSTGNRHLSGSSTGETDSYHVGAYATWIGNDGIYVDMLGKLNLFKNSFDTLSTDGSHVTGSYSTPGIGMSVELGRHIELDKGWFVEPQMQLTTLWIKGKDYSASNGLQFEVDHSQSIQTRFGAVVGKKIKTASGHLVQPYVKLSGVHEFDGVDQVRSNGHAFRSDLGGSRVEGGFGVAAELGRNSRLYVDLETAKGPKVSEPWGINFGYRYAW
ncbi:autotransporter outer membrane beta-barrel domain-containing protein [Herbaspirillum sp. SJZ099]|uniref:autotransporter outer membrane beta-barrel domain-containing protein n=1 Tax=Herbaspirillum sp. SJZ099 TaxID=2572916 RepID=UPI0011A10C8E|nr:autotransporter outer membrane beta-barrel domain-containing protein [Herbaspirillum sp. SJZ099]TWC71709.1 outer membrane autotransporter protein [Herbaspirillum sp. SJZ099]